jgi:hypothetical protein
MRTEEEPRSERRAGEGTIGSENVSGGEEDEERRGGDDSSVEEEDEEERKGGGIGCD